MAAGVQYVHPGLGWTATLRVVWGKGLGRKKATAAAGCPREVAAGAGEKAARSSRGACRRFRASILAGLREVEMAGGSEEAGGGDLALSPQGKVRWGSWMQTSSLCRVPLVEDKASASPRGLGAKRREPSSLRSIPSAKRKTKASSQSSAPVSALASSQSSLPARNHGGCSWPVAWKSSRPCSARASFPFLSGTVRATGLSSVSLLPRSNTRCAFQAAAASLSHEAFFPWRHRRELQVQDEWQGCFSQ